MNNQNSNSLLSGIMITTGCTIGAGMFSLPIVASGMWFWWSLVIMVSIWFLNYLSSLVILEINMNYPAGASFDTFVKDILGKKWNLVTGLGVAFLMYILLYAYFSAFGNMASHTLGWDAIDSSRWMNGLMSLGFGSILGVIVWKSTAMVGRISTVLVVGMVIAFVLSMAGLSVQVDSSKLLNSIAEDPSYAKYIWASLPYFLTSFGFSSVVPSLYKYFGNDSNKIKNSLLFGSLTALLVYFLFIFVSFGLISRPEFIPINASGGNMGSLVSAMTNNSSGSTISSALTLFSNFAIISSFLGVGLSLFDYIADLLQFEDNNSGRLKTAAITFLPAGIASFFFPHGFIAAIGFAGLVMVFSYFIVPFLMAWKIRQEGKKSSFRVWGGKYILVFILAASTLIVVCHLLGMLEVLPRY
jgi:tryptophan-specific transport protein